MLYRNAGRTGERVSILGFGCMRLPVRQGKAHVIEEDKAQAMVDYAIAGGVNYFDTAYVYHSEVPFHAGASELFLGRALKGRRNKVHLATKLPTWFIETRADMDRYLDDQLNRLQTDHIDFYLVHCLTGDFCRKLTPMGRSSSRSWTPTTGRSARFSTISWTRISRRGGRGWNTRRARGWG